MTTTGSRAARKNGTASVVQLRPRPGARPLTPTATALRSHFAAARSASPDQAPMVDVICAVLDRGHRKMLPAHRRTWERFLELLAQHGTDPRALRNCAVMANLVAVAIFDERDDHTTTASLARTLGHRRLARIHHRCGAFLEANPGLPLTTAAVRQLLASDLADRVGGDAAAACAAAAHHLVVEGVDETWTVPTLDSSEEFLDIVERGTVVEWRHHLSMVAAGPWSPYSYRLVELARASGRPHTARMVADVVELCREQYKERERELIAQEIRRLVALSGATQREFAQWLGTSPSRLSTYMSGAVTPSAALLLRMKRTSLALQARPEAPDAAPARPVLLSVPCGDGRTARLAGHAAG